MMKSKSTLVALALAAVMFSAPAAQAYESGAPAARQHSRPTEVTAFRHVEAISAVSFPGASSLQPELTASQAAPIVELVRANQYAMRQIARQEPYVTPSWREVPSV